VIGTDRLDQDGNLTRLAGAGLRSAPRERIRPTIQGDLTMVRYIDDRATGTGTDSDGGRYASLKGTRPRGGNVITPREFLQDVRLTAGAKVIMQLIQDEANFLRDDEIDYPLQKLANEVRTSQKTVTQRITELVDLGFLKKRTIETVTGRIKKSHNLYTPLPWKECEYVIQVSNSLANEIDRRLGD
jgi:hypothetical protein